VSQNSGAFLEIAKPDNTHRVFTPIRWHLYPSDQETESAASLAVIGISAKQVGYLHDLPYDIDGNEVKMLFPELVRYSLGNPTRSASSDLETSARKETGAR
jgi:hypothetical protein